MPPLPVPPPQAGAGPVSTRRALAISLTQPLPLLAAGRALHFQPRRAVSGFDGTVVVFALAGGLLFLGSFLVPFTDQGSWAFAEKPFGTALWLLMMGGLAAACLTGGARVAARCVRDLRWNALRHDVIVGLKGVTLRTVDGRERISFAAAAQREVLRRTPRGLDRVIAARAIGVEAGLRRQHVFVAEWLALGGAGRSGPVLPRCLRGRPVRRRAPRPPTPRGVRGPDRVEHVGRVARPCVRPARGDRAGVAARGRRDRGSRRARPGRRRVVGKPRCKRSRLMSWRRPRSSSVPCRRRVTRPYRRGLSLKAGAQQRGPRCGGRVALAAGGDEATARLGALRSRRPSCGSTRVPPRRSDRADPVSR